MKLFGLLLIFSTFLNLSCQRNVESSPIAESERIVESPQITRMPVQFEEIRLAEKFSTEFEPPTDLSFDGYEIEHVTVRKKDNAESVEADIFDAVLSKNGKTLARFDGEYYPLGNFMSFGLFPLLGDAEKQLLVFDESYKYERNWVVSLKPKYEVIFDSRDYGIWWSNLGAVDIDKDGVFELIVSQSQDFELASYNAEYAVARVVFKYDPKIRKFTPANHILTNYSLRDIDERIQKYKAVEEKNFRDFLDIMLNLFYVGKETEAWKFFDENFIPKFSKSAVTREREKTRESIRAELAEDPIYQFVTKDLKKQK